MTRCVVISESPMSYRHPWFAHLQHSSSLDVHVVYLAGQQTDRPWEADVVGGTGSDWITWARTLTPFGTEKGYFPRLAVDIAAILDRASPDVVVLPGWAHPVCWQAARWCRRHGTPYGVTFESWQTQAQTRLPGGLTARLRSRLLHGSAVAMPAGTRAVAFAQGLGVAPVVAVHANTCDSEGIAAATAGRATTSPPTVLYAGRLLEHKGIDLVLAAAPRLVGAGARVRIVGDGPERPAVEAAAARGLVDFAGPLPPQELYGVMAEAAVVVVPSRAEPWGVVVHDALSAGMPVVASTAVGSASDLVGPDVGTVVEAETGAIVAACSAWLGRRGSGDDDAALAAACRAAATRVSYRTATAELEQAIAVALGERS